MVIVTVLVMSLTIMVVVMVMVVTMIARLVMVIYDTGDGNRDDSDGDRSDSDVHGYMMMTLGIVIETTVVSVFTIMMVIVLVSGNCDGGSFNRDDVSGRVMVTVPV